MDALEFLRVRKRICYLYDECNDCPLKNTVCTDIETTSDEDFKRAIATVEQWSNEHSRKTRQSVFLKQFPDAELDESGVITICPAQLSDAHRNGDGVCKNPSIACSECCSEFWMQEVE